MKSLKDEGVPFTARVLFRVRHVPFFAMVAVFLLFLPLLIFWTPPNAFARMCKAVERRAYNVGVHRARVVALYRPEGPR